MRAFFVSECLGKTVPLLTHCTESLVFQLYDRRLAIARRWMLRPLIAASKSTQKVQDDKQSDLVATVLKPQWPKNPQTISQSKGIGCPCYVAFFKPFSAALPECERFALCLFSSQRNVYQTTYPVEAMEIGTWGSWRSLKLALTHKFASASQQAGYRIN